MIAADRTSPLVGRRDPSGHGLRVRVGACVSCSQSRAAPLSPTMDCPGRYRMTVSNRSARGEILFREREVVLDKVASRVSRRASARLAAPAPVGRVCPYAGSYKWH